jgi:hypothetical protein
MSTSAVTTSGYRNPPVNLRPVARSVAVMTAAAAAACGRVAHW